VSWNAESGGALQPAVADRIAAFDGVDIWGLVEVLAVDAEAYEFAAEEGEGADFDSLLGTTGAADRILLIWDAERFERTGGGELSEIALGGRAPLWVQLRNTTTLDEFIVVANHLHRANEDARRRQSELLNAWAAQQELPVIGLGDYNYDWDLVDGDDDHDAGYDFLTADGVWVWVRPDELVTTQCSGWPCRYRSVLDFVFVAGPARMWPGESEIVVAEGDFPDDNTTPDHRPVRAVLVALPSIPEGGVPTANGNANLRAGPGNQYPVVGRTAAGRPLDIVARDVSGNWLQLATGAWIATFFVTTPPTMLPVADAPDAAVTGTPAAPVIGVQLGEIFFDGDVPQVESDEYVEIVNEGATVDLNGWQLRDDDGSLFVFPPYVLETGKRCRVYTNELHADHCGFSFGARQPVWTNSGDVAILLDATGAEIDRECWGRGCN
jgi:hypothetical protein